LADAAWAGLSRRLIGTGVVGAGLWWTFSLWLY
jgi:hypothetical protein